MRKLKLELLADCNRGLIFNCTSYLGDLGGLGPKKKLTQKFVTQEIMRVHPLSARIMFTAVALPSFLKLYTLLVHII